MSAPLGKEYTVSDLEVANPDPITGARAFKGVLDVKNAAAGAAAAGAAAAGAAAAGAAAPDSNAALSANANSAIKGATDPAAAQAVQDALDKLADAKERPGTPSEEIDRLRKAVNDAVTRLRASKVNVNNIRRNDNIGGGTSGSAGAASGDPNIAAKIAASGGAEPMDGGRRRRGTHRHRSNRRASRRHRK